MTHLSDRINQYRDSPTLFCPPAGTVPHALSLFGLGAVPVHDLNGNLTSDGTRTYTYDFENRLASVAGPGLTASYTYDPFGRRSKKTVKGVVTRFIYDGDQILLEKDGSGTVIAQYTYGPGIDEPLTMTRNNITYYYFYDGLGSVTDLTKASGELVESYQYDVYGQPLPLSSVGNRFYFTGREFDPETGLYHYRARAYHPGIGRFGQRDPVDHNPDVNLYRYVRNNPINLIDPLGLMAASTEGHLPPGWSENWEWRPGTRGTGNRWWDTQGGEWRWHSPDRFHPEGHWDYNPWDRWNSPWRNVPAEPPLQEPLPPRIPWWQKIPPIIPDPFPIVPNPCAIDPSLPVCGGKGNEA